MILIFIFLYLSGENDNIHEMIIEANKIGAPIQPTMYGIFFEDINYGADGGLYGELIKNRSFQFEQNFSGWVTFGNVKLKDDGPFPNNPHYVRLGYPGHPQKHTGLENEGFFGIGVKSGLKYRFSVWARCIGSEQRISIELMKSDRNDDSQAFVIEEMKIDSTEWKKYELIFTSSLTEYNSHFRLFLQTPGEVDLCHISLFPVETFNMRKNGLRKDLAEALFDLKPGVFRFPGGCVVEGLNEQTRYQWKNTIGEVENRPVNENLWGYSNTFRFFPQYYQSLGLGFFEYFQLAEDIGAEPLPVLNVDMVCQARNTDDQQLPLSMIGQFIQDALDLIEFANGDANDTKWGKIRSEMGHEKPFNLKFLSIGNEQWGVLYPERLDRFVSAIRHKYPYIKIIGSSGPNVDDIMFDYLWKEMRVLKTDLVDEHYYRDEEWFLSHADRYDKYDRNGPKVFAGEYACHGTGKKYNHFNASLLEAAFMTGLERNADIVHMATYAPLFAHVQAWQWRPDLIWFDNLRVVKTCSYYVQQLFSLNKGTNVLPLKMNDQFVCGKDGQDGLYASSVFDNKTNSLIVKVVNTKDIDQNILIKFEGLEKSVKLINGTCTTFHSDDLVAENTLDEPYKVIPIEKSISIEGHILNTDIKAKTFAVFKFIKDEN